MQEFVTSYERFSLHVNLHVLLILVHLIVYFLSDLFVFIYLSIFI